MTDMPETLMLRNGVEAATAVVVVTFTHLKKMFHEEPLCFWDAVMIARDPNYQPFGTNGHKLVGWGILDNDEKTMHAAIREVILAAVEGDGLEMKLVNPVRPITKAE